MNRLLLTSMALAAVWPGLAAAQSQVIDSARMFSPEAVRSAESAFKTFHERTNAEIVVETVSTIGKVSAGADKLPGFEQDKILANATETRASAKGVAGIYILICRDPAKSRYVSSRNMIDRRDAKAVHDAMLAGLKEGRPDEGLRAAVKALESVQTPKAQTGNLRQKAAAPGANEGGGTASMLWTLLFIAIGVWVVMALIRAMSGGGAGGGGFFQSMLGGLFGAAAGMWLYNSLSNSGAFGGGTGDSGYDSGGGDFGDTGSGGGDWGGGGDFGGSGDF